MTKQQIVSEALAHGYSANYDGRNKKWFFKRYRPSGNKQSFDRVVFFNLTRKLGIENQVEEIK